MDLRENVLEESKKYQEFMNTLEIEDFNRYTRKELEEFKKELQSIRIPSIYMELNNIIKQKKVEEYPELKKAYNYPILNGMTILAEDEIIKLDKYLAMLKKGNAIFTLSKSGFHYRKENEVRDWLIDRGVIERCFAIICESCRGDIVTGYIPEVRKEEFVEALERYNRTGEKHELLDTLKMECYECDEEAEVEELVRRVKDGTIRYKYINRLVMERNTRLDNV